jgi:hypothetical protein
MNKQYVPSTPRGSPVSSGAVRTPGLSEAVELEQQIKQCDRDIDLLVQNRKKLYEEFCHLTSHVVSPGDIIRCSSNDKHQLLVIKRIGAGWREAGEYVAINFDFKIECGLVSNVQEELDKGYYKFVRNIFQG